jgi:hypothetical protein
MLRLRRAESSDFGRNRNNIPTLGHNDSTMVKLSCDANLATERCDSFEHLAKSSMVIHCLGNWNADLRSQIYDLSTLNPPDGNEEIDTMEIL